MTNLTGYAFLEVIHDVLENFLEVQNSKNCFCDVIALELDFKKGDQVRVISPTPEIILAICLKSTFKFTI